MGQRCLLALLTMAVVAGACSSDDAPRVAEPTSPTSTTQSLEPTSPPASTEAPLVTERETTAPASASTPESSHPEPTSPAGSPPLDAGALVEVMAADELEGRDNGTAGSLAAQQILIGQLAQFAQPAFPDMAGDDGFRQAFSLGTNLLGVIPGGDLADEWVVLGAHYDHLGTSCRIEDPTDRICNGATDNATGVAVAMGAARAIAAAGTPRRSVLVALWDAEEDGLLGSAAYLEAPLAPPAATTAYINFDNQGSNLLPSIANFTVMVGAETGGADLVDTAVTATAASTLQTIGLSLVFGQGRSDHANFANAGVPSVFFTDATGPCYHTPYDDVDVVDFAKLDQQVATATALAVALVATDTPPVFEPNAPLATYEDALALLAITSAARADFYRFGPAGQAASEHYVADLQAIVDAGPEAFDDAAIGTLLAGAAMYVDALTQGECDGFLP